MPPHCPSSPMTPSDTPSDYLPSGPEPHAVASFSLKNCTPKPLNPCTWRCRLKSSLGIGNPFLRLHLGGTGVVR